MTAGPRDLGHDHDTWEIKAVGQCVRCDWARGTVALESVDR